MDKSQAQSDPLEKLLNPQLLGIIGSIVLFIGVFTPILSIPIIGNVNYFANGKGDGVIVLILGAASFVFASLKKFKPLIFTGLLSLAVMIFTFVNFQLKMSQATPELSTKLADNPLAGIGQVMVNSVQIQWGWAVLIIGAGLLIFAGFKRQDNSSEFPLPGIDLPNKLDLPDAGDSTDEEAVSDTGIESGTLAKHDPWKTAFIVLCGVMFFSGILIYVTYTRQTSPTTQLQPDANGQPVQPINPATGIPEQNLANMQGMSAETLSNSNMAVPPGTLPGGDGYDPWKNGVRPPPGAPVGPGGQIVTIDPNNPSPFMTNDGPCIPQPSGILLCPAPANKAVKPTPKPNAANANVQVSPIPKSSPEIKPSPTVEKPSTKPTPPKTQSTPAKRGKPKNGDEQF